MMKKILGLVFVGALAFGGSAAFAGDGVPGGVCDDPIDVACETDEEEPQDCLVYINLDDPQDANGCHNL